jgi:hypothetical protein
MLQFINLASGSKMKVSDSLQPCTKAVNAAPDFPLDNYAVRLLDTPGFDYSDWSDVRVFETIAKFLADQYAKTTSSFH